jgi:hypothetical protein
MTTLATIDLGILRLIPEGDLAEFTAMTDSAQSIVLARIGWIHRIKTARRGTKNAIAKAAAATLGVAPSAVHRYLGDYKRQGWRGLRDERMSGLGAKGLSPLFKSFIAGLFDAHQRDHDDAAEVHRKLIDRWNTWRQTGDSTFAVPGYTSPPSAEPSTGAPHGWSYDNILRLRPKAPARALAKHGAKSAAAHLPPVLTTRVGSAVHSRRLYDDQDLDNLLADGHLAISGLADTMRPVSFNSLDFYTAAHLSHHLRAIAKDPETSKNKTLTGMEFVWFVIRDLQTWGYRTDDLGTELIFEHGTANTWRNKDLNTFQGHASFEDAINAITGGKCFVNRSGKFEGPMFAELCFKPQGTGNFKFKTWLESAFRLLRTYMQSLPGQIGSHQRINGKDELYGIKLEERKLLKAISEVVDPQTQVLLAASLEHELLDLQTFHDLVNAVYRAVNARTNHVLEGWHQCRFTTALWRLSETSEIWFTQDELPADPEERRYLLKRINGNRDQLTKIDRLPPVEALAIETRRDAAHIAKLPDHVVGLVLPRQWAQLKKIGKQHCFTLANPLWPDTQDTYVASWDERGAQVTLDIGKELLVYHNPFHDGRAQVHDINGAYITTLYPTVRAEPFSPEKTLIQLQTRSAVQSGHEAHLRARMADIGTDRQEKRQINRDLLQLTREDRHRAGQRKTAAAPAPAAAVYQPHGEATDWDNYQPELCDAPADFYGDLPDETPLDPSL